MAILNLKIREKLISVLLASSIAVSMTGCSTRNNNSLPNKMANGAIISTYLDDDLSSEVKDTIPNTLIQNVFGYNNDWDLIVYKDSVGFVYHNHIEEFAHNPYVKISELSGNVTTTTRLNFRVGPSTDFKSLRVLGKNVESEVLGITDSNWYIVKNNGQIGYVYGKYVTYEPNKEIDETLASSIENASLLYTTTSVNFRKGPGVNSDKITTLSKNTPVEFVGYIDNDWYKVKYKGQIGYICGKYIRSSENLTYTTGPVSDVTASFNKPATGSVTTTENTTPAITPFGEYRKDIQKVVYATSDTPLRTAPDMNASTTYSLDKFEVCEVLSSDGTWYNVRCRDITGFIPISSTQELTNVYVVVDISAQKLTLYQNNVILLETDVTTGKKDKHDTPHGMYSINKKQKDTYLRGADYCCHVDYWMPFYKGYGLHDADWRSSFGGTLYENSGSHGCVNIPPELAGTVYDTVDVGTLVLVHK